MATNARATAAQARKADAESPKKTALDQKMIAALLAERGGYVTRGMTDRVALVDKQIRAYGGEPPKVEGNPDPDADADDTPAADADADDTPAADADAKAKK